jgi:hypothetical protein
MCSIRWPGNRFCRKKRVNNLKWPPSSHTNRLMLTMRRLMHSSTDALASDTAPMDLKMIAFEISFSSATTVRVFKWKRFYHYAQRPRQFLRISQTCNVIVNGRIPMVSMNFI